MPPVVVGVATFQPSIWMASMLVEVCTASVVLLIPVSKDARYVIVCPGVKGELQSPTALPGSPFTRSYPLSMRVRDCYKSNSGVVAYEGQHKTRVLDPD